MDVGGTGILPARQKRLYAASRRAGAHPASYSVVMAISFPAKKRPGRDDRSLQPTTNLRTSGATSPHPHTPWSDA